MCLWWCCSLADVSKVAAQDAQKALEQAPPPPASPPPPSPSPASPAAPLSPAWAGRCSCKPGGLDCRDKRCGCRKRDAHCSSSCGCGGACSNSAAPPTPPAPLAVAARGPGGKERIHYRVVAGGAPAHVLHSKLGELIRDGGISHKLSDVQALHGLGDFYLTRARVAAAAGALPLLCRCSAAACAVVAQSAFSDARQPRRRRRTRRGTSCRWTMCVRPRWPRLALRALMLSARRR